MRVLLWAILALGLAVPATAQIQVERSRSAVPSGALTATAAAGTTVDANGLLRHAVYKVTVDEEAFVCAAQTCDVTLATLPAKTKVLTVVANVTETFACAETCTTSTLSATAGTSAGGDEYLLSFDVDAATLVWGDGGSEAGASLVASAIQFGDLPSFSSATTVSTRLTSGTGDLGDDEVNFLSQGSVTFYIVYVVLP